MTKVNQLVIFRPGRLAPPAQPSEAFQQSLERYGQEQRSTKDLTKAGARTSPSAGSVRDARAPRDNLFVDPRK